MLLVLVKAIPLQGVLLVDVLLGCLVSELVSWGSLPHAWAGLTPGLNMLHFILLFLCFGTRLCFLSTIAGCHNAIEVIEISHRLCGVGLNGYFFADVLRVGIAVGPAIDGPFRRIVRLVEGIQAGA
jgi:hypothetical protein